MARRYFLIAAPLALLACIIGGFLVARAETATGDVTVGLTVPSTQGGGGQQNNPAPPANPTITNVASTTDFTSATVTWTASGPVGISQSNFVYGLTNNYGLSGNISGSYQASLANLTAGTVYFFKISVTDANGKSATHSDWFRTKTPVDNTPPVISGSKSVPADTTATITWTTNEIADSQVQYGLTNQFGSNVADAAKVVNHSIQLKNLLPNTTYHYRTLSTDSAGNTATAPSATFLTLKDNVAPPDVSSLALKATSSTIVLTWVNPSAQAVPDFTGVTLVRKVNSKSTNVGDGTVVYKGGSQTVTDKNVLENVVYFYTSFSMDTSGNYSPGAFDSITIAPPPNKEICNNGVDDNANAKIDCADSDCTNDEACKAPLGEICNNGIDDDKNGKIDCADSVCSKDQACQAPLAEVCNNNLDDDKDGYIDCRDADCKASPFCPAQNEMCANGIDDDKNGKIDCADAACFGFQACQKTNKDLPGAEDSYKSPAPTVSNLARLSPEMFVFLVANNQIILTPKKGVVAAVAGLPIMVEIGREAIPFAPESIVLKINGGEQHNLTYNKSADVYYAVIVAPATGNHQLALEVAYQNKQFDAVTVGLNSQTFGVATGGFGSLAGASIMLLKEDGAPWPAADFGQVNPFITNTNGTFYWMAPNGRYTIKITSPGYYDRTISGINVTDNIINTSFTLITKPPALTDGIDPNASLAANAKTVVGNTLKTGVATARRAAQFAKDKADDPAVEKVASQQVAPAAVTVAAAGTLPLITFSDIMPLLRYLFLQPLMLLGIRKRAKWGQIYNTLTKLPVDLATVRLISIATGRMIQSKVTDKKGRYAFVIDPGEYKIEVVKNNLLFPSELLKNFKTDGGKIDIYHGESIKVTEDEAVITANIPLDPAGSGELPKRFYVKLAMRHVQNIVSWAGLVITAVSLYIAPHWYVWVLLAVHSAFLFLFWRLARPPKVKSWGIMYDKDTKAPVGQAVARLFSSQFNKLVGTQITDRKGRYYFLAGESQYFVTGEHRDYQPIKSDIVDLTGTEDDTIALNLGLVKGQPPPAVQPTQTPTAPDAVSSTIPAAAEEKPAPQELVDNPPAPPVSPAYPLPPPEKEIG